MKKRTHKIIIKTILLLSFIIPFKISGLPQYHMGVFLPLSGEQQSIGQDIKEGVEIFLDYMNEVKGFESFMLKTTIFDTQSQTQNTQKIAEILSQTPNSYHIFAGGVQQEEFLSIQQLANKTQAPYLFPFCVSFNEPLNLYTFPLLPSLFDSFRFILNFFKSKNLEVKIVYDETTKEKALTLTSPENLIDYQNPQLKTEAPKVALIFVKDSHVEEVLAKTQGLSIRVLNYHQINLASQSQDKTLWEDVLFINWVKSELKDAVKFFQETFQEKKQKKPNNYHMLGWILADMVYETLYKTTGKKNQQGNNLDIIKELESLTQKKGYNEGCAYNLYYNSFDLPDPFKRLGISGLYFMKYSQKSFKIISDFYPLNKKEEEK